MSLRKPALAAAIFMALTGCAADPAVRLATSQHIAASADMTASDVRAGPFLLRTYQRVTDPSRGTTRLYIEGDGLSWLSRNRPSPDPTPIHPLALSLASLDPSPNVIYLARPCQFNGPSSETSCPEKYWLSARFAPEVIHAMDEAVSTIKQRHGLKAFELVGYSGGAAVAVLIASRRTDVISLRTVAGNLDTATFSRLHNVSPMTQSLNPVDVAQRVNSLPQRHFVGDRDSVMPASILQAYLKAAGLGRQGATTVVQNADHEAGWAERWPFLLAQAPPLSIRLGDVGSR